MTRQFPAAVAKAQDFAVKAHADHGDTYGDQPYSVHLDAVDDLLIVAGYEEDLAFRQVGFLHDVVEDTDETPQTLWDAGFSTDVIQGVEFCSDEAGHNRKTRKAKTYARMAKQRASFAADRTPTNRFIRLGIIAKLVDRLSNIASSQADNPGLADMYWKEKDTFRSALYLEGVADALWAEYDKFLAVRPPKPRRGRR